MPLEGLRGPNNPRIGVRTVGGAVDDLLKTIRLFSLPNMALTRQSLLDQPVTYSFNRETRHDTAKSPYDNSVPSISFPVITLEASITSVLANRTTGFTIGLTTHVKHPIRNIILQKSLCCSGKLSDQDPGISGQQVHEAV